MIDLFSDFIGSFIYFMLVLVGYCVCICLPFAYFRYLVNNVLEYGSSGGGRSFRKGLMGSNVRVQLAIIGFLTIALFIVLLVFIFRAL